LTRVSEQYCLFVNPQARHFLDIEAIVAREDEEELDEEEDEGVDDLGKSHALVIHRGLCVSFR